MPKVTVQGGSTVNLTQKDFVAQGGEGAVYRRGDTAYKIYADPKKMIPTAKIQELSALSSQDYILNPLSVLLSGKKNTPVGYTMRYVTDTHPLCQVFTKAFRERHGVDEHMTFDLVKKLQTGVNFIHNEGLLVVDLNEMNFLVDGSFNEVYFIDVDSYKTKSYPPTALMESVRDRHSPNVFNQGTDWFAFAVVSFQLFIGIHPYKGKHPKFDKSDWDGRMTANMSVLNPDVKIPKVCRPFTVIPLEWIAWYDAVFEEGCREAPPTEGGIITVVAQVQHITGSDNFIFKKVLTMEDDIIDLVTDNASELVVTTREAYSGATRLIGYEPGMVVTLTPKKSAPVGAEVNGANIDLINLMNGQAIGQLVGDQIMRYDNRLYIKTMDKLMEITFVEAGVKITPIPVQVCNVLENATKLEEGVVVQNLLGAYYPFIPAQSKTCYQSKIDELADHRVISAKFDNGVCMIIAQRLSDNEYIKYIIRFNDDYSKYDIRVIDDPQVLSTNFVSLDSGACVHIVEDEKVEVFSNVMGSAKVKLIDDDSITTDMQLVKRKGQVAFLRGAEVHSLTMK